MKQKKLKAIIENLLLVADQPISLEKFIKIFQLEFEREEIKSALKELIEEYAERNLQIQEVAGGYQLCTKMEYSDWVRKFYKLDKGAKLSPAALDTLSIIAYKQPITRAEIEDIRGVDSGGVVKTLFERKLLRLMGRKQVIGRPILYGTSNKFLEYFGLRDISELPTLKEFAEKSDEEILPLQADLPFEQGTDSAPEEDEELYEGETDSVSKEIEEPLEEEIGSALVEEGLPEEEADSAPEEDGELHEGETDSILEEMEEPLEEETGSIPEEADLPEEEADSAPEEEN